MKLTRAQRRVLNLLADEQRQIDAGTLFPRWRKSYPSESGIWWKLVRRGLAVYELRNTAHGPWCRIWLTARGLQEVSE